MSEPKLAAGIDTGGTYTDAVIIELGSKKILGSAKSPTTHYDLSLGVSSALEQALAQSGIEPGRIELVSLSTTLATNSVVEEKGGQVGLFVIGFEEHMELPVAFLKHVDGGHKWTGEEEARLDLETIIDSLTHMGGRVDSYAVCAQMSVMNPTHELVAARAIQMIDPRPVFCSHQVSGRCGMKERTATAVLHARLMPIMGNFLEKVEASLSSMGSRARVVIARGDAKTVSMAEAVERAASTVASGPAASAYYGSSFSPSEDAVVVDVGGTTTDITVIHGRRPSVNEEGSIIGALQTHIEAVETFTAGIGGDSRVRPEKSTLHIGPVRVVPLAMAGVEVNFQGWAEERSEPKCIIPNPGASAAEAEDPYHILDFLRERGPSTPKEIEEGLSISAIRLDMALKDFIHDQLVFESAFTPTDALHVLGLLDLGNRQASRRGAEVLAGRFGTDVHEFCRQVLRATEQKIEDAILSHILRREMGSALTGFLTDRRSSSLLNIKMTLRVPIVGLGAAGRCFLPGVAERLGCDLYFPSHYEVGNALGAVIIASEESEGA